MSEYHIALQIERLVSRLVVGTWISFCVSSRFNRVGFIWEMVVGRVIVEYTRAWMVARSFIPCVQKFLEMVVLMLSGMCLQVLLLARWSASSFPCSLVWPLVHLKDVSTVCHLRRYAAFWNYWLFFTLVHTVSFQLGRCLVRLLRTYLESVMHVRGVRGSASWSATTMAVISPVWFDCSRPGTWMA